MWDMAAGQRHSLPWENRPPDASPFCPDKGSMQAVVVIIPALNSLSTLLVVSCILWKTCRRRARLTYPSPPSP